MTKTIEISDVQDLFNLPLFSLLDLARESHRKNFRSAEVQAATLLSIKTGGCPENCSYCPQSAHYDTGVQKTGVMDCESVLQSALNAKSMGATRFCMGAAWRNVKEGPEFEAASRPPFE